MDSDLLIAVLSGTIIAATPLLYAALGELLAEVSGVLNLSVEGMMMAGAMLGFVCTKLTGLPWWGVVAAVSGGALLALIFAGFTVGLQINQVVVGLAMGVFAEGFARFFGKPYVGTTAPSIFTPLPIPGLSRIPILGPILFNHNILVYLSYLLVPAAWFLLYRTQIGLSLRAVGEKPRSAEVAGVNVFRVRYAAVVVGGALAGLAGAFLSVGSLNGWTEGMTAGRGWIALALVIVASWNPVKLLPGCYLFGFAMVMALQSQTMAGVAGRVSVYFVQMLPYLVAIVILAVTGRQLLRRRVAAPAALTLPYVREER